MNAQKLTFNKKVAAPYLAALKGLGAYPFMSANSAAEILKVDPMIVPAIPAVPAAIIPALLAAPVMLAILEAPVMLAILDAPVMLAILDGAVENNVVDDMVVIMHGLDINEDADYMHEAYDEYNNEDEADDNNEDDAEL
jgi:hypothetical protein